MKRFKQFSISFLALVIAAPILVIAPVFAQRASDDSPDQVTSSQSDDSSNSDSPSDATTVKTEDDSTSGEFHHIEDKSALRQRGREAVAELKKDHEAKTVEQLKQACLARKDKIDNRTDHLLLVTKRIQNRIDNILAKVKAFQKAKSLSSDELTATAGSADAAQAHAAAAVSTLASLQPNINCDSIENAANLAAFKEATRTARSDLKTYKQDVKAYLVVLRAAATPAKPTEDQ